MKKIVVIGNSPSGLYDFRGALIQELIKQGNEVIVLTPQGLKYDELPKLGARVIETPLDRRGMNPRKDAVLMRLYSNILNRERPDLVITYTIKPNIYGGFASKKRKIRYAANITGLGTTFQNEGRLKRLVIRLYTAGLKKASVVFFENIENRDIFVKNNICPVEKTYVLNGAGVDVQHFYLADYPKDEKFIFLFVGRVMKEKGIDELFDAMQRLYAEDSRCRLTVLGNYEEDYKERVEHFIEEGWLDYKGYQNDVRPFIEQSHCFVLPSWHEGMANTNLECASMGRPVITSNIHGCLEAVEDGVSGFLSNKQDADDLYRVMKEFVGLSYEQRKEMGLAGRKRMEELFDKRVVVQNTMDRLFDKK